LDSTIKLTHRSPTRKAFVDVHHNLAMLIFVLARATHDAAEFKAGLKLMIDAAGSCRRL
jgi:hypothetical protein